MYMVLQMLAKCSFLQKVSDAAVICILHTWFTTLVCIYMLPSKTQHMYINTVMKYQLHQGYMFQL